MDLERAARTLWAKSANDNEPWHPLLAHLLDVAACAEAILALEPPRTRLLVATDLGLDEEGAVRWTAALAGLHDLGKASPAFQTKSVEEWVRVKALGLNDPGANQQSYHSVISDVLMSKLLTRHGWRRTAAKHAANAVGAHHGYRATSDALRKIAQKDEGKDTWPQVQELLIQRVLDVVNVPPAPTLLELSGAAFQRLAGLTSFADWIGSSLPRVPLNDDDRIYYRGARDRADAKLAEIGWRAWQATEGTVPPFEEMFAYVGSADRPFVARPLQRMMADLVGGVGGGEPVLLIVEAPMGEGKTEAALYAYEVLRDKIGHRGLYVALPTQATSNQMFERVRKHLESQGRSDILDLQLLHGGKDLNETFEAMKIRPNYLADAGELQAAVAASVWFTNRKRALLSEHGVGTVDQALLSVLPVGHQFVRMWGLANRVVILDEIHAYDTYTSELIATMLRWLHALGSSVVLMSATLPASVRKNLAGAFGAGEIKDASYPRITLVERNEAITRSFPAASWMDRPPLRIEEMGVDLGMVAERAQALVEAGGCVACIVNTVQRAQELAQLLRSHLDISKDELMLFHARFPADERREIETRVLNRFGPGGDRPTRSVLVATQVVEQSLDLDFDAMITDLAPIDLLLQRAGRMHRHAGRDRHGHNIPLLAIAGLAAEGDLPDLVSAYFDKVYEPYVLLRSWLALREQAEIDLPDDIDRLVQEVYEEEAGNLPESITDALEVAYQVMKVRHQGALASAVNAVIGDPDDGSWEVVPEREWSDDDGDVSARVALTRIGRPSISVVPIYQTKAGEFLDAAESESALLSGAFDTTGAKRVFQRAIRVSRPEIYHALKNDKPLGKWGEHPLTRNLRPLVFVGGEAIFGRLSVRLDPWLGLIYE